MAIREYDHPDFERARALQQRVGICDLHVDCIIQQQLFGYDIRKEHRRPMWGQRFIWHADIPRMIKAGYGGACMGIHYWPFESDRAWPSVSKQLDALDRLAADDPRVMRVNAPEDWDLARERGLMGMAPGIEGAHLLGGRLHRVEALAARGAAYLTLAHFSKNSAATPSMGRGANEVEGLTGFGRELVAELNRFGVAVDCAHVNTPGTLEICKLSSAPVFCTHTGVKAVREHARNITDAEIDAIAATDGAIGLMFSRQFLAGGGLPATSETIADHIEHIIRRVGPRHVAIGSDFDGWVPIFKDQRDCLDIVKLTHILLQRGHSEEDVALMLRGNALRVHKAVRAARTATPKAQG